MSEKASLINDEFTLMIQVLERIRSSGSLGRVADRGFPDLEILPPRVKRLQADALEIAATVRYCGLVALEAHCEALTHLVGRDLLLDELLANLRRDAPDNLRDFEAWFNKFGDAYAALEARAGNYGRELATQLFTYLQEWQRRLDDLRDILRFEPPPPWLAEACNWTNEARSFTRQTNDPLAILADIERARSHLARLEGLLVSAVQTHAQRADELQMTLRQVSPERLCQTHRAAYERILGEGRRWEIYSDPVECLRHLCVNNEDIRKLIERIKAAEPRWGQIAARLDDLRALKNGWLDARGIAPSSQGLDWLAECLSCDCPDNCPLPYLYPTADGGVQAEWSIGAYEITLEIDLDHRAGEWHSLDTRTQADDWKELDLAQPESWTVIATEIERMQGFAGEHP